MTLAALLHDLGHPAFSHLFEKFMQSNAGVRNKYQSVEWTHETASKLLIETLLYDTSIETRSGGRHKGTGSAKDEHSRSLHDMLKESVPGWSDTD